MSSEDFFNKLSGKSAVCVIDDINEAYMQLFNSKIKRKPMSLKVTKPILVGTTNILTATHSQLTTIIREAKEQIAVDEDMYEISKVHREAKAELEEVIALCVEQLNK